MSYTLIHQFNTQHAHVKFTGSFKGEIVTWDTDFYTLEGFLEEENINDTNLKQFIDIRPLPLQSGVMKLTVVLNINKVNEPSIQKMMIMIKHYKKLSLGRHEYG